MLRRVCEGTRLLVRPAALQTWDNFLFFCFLTLASSTGVLNVVGGLQPSSETLHAGFELGLFLIGGALRVPSGRTKGQSRVSGLSGTREDEHPKLRAAAFCTAFKEAHYVLAPLFLQHAQEAIQALMSKARVAIFSFWVAA